MLAGRIRQIFIMENDTGSDSGLVKIERFSTSAGPDSRINMPVLYRDALTEDIDIVPVCVSYDS